jgi:hypothetical protein
MLGVMTNGVATLGVSLPVVLYGSRGSSLLYLQSSVGGVMFGVGFPSSCPVASRGSSCLDSEFWVGVTVLGVGLPASCRMAYSGSSALNMASCVGVGLSAMFDVPSLGLFWVLSRRSDAPRRLASSVSNGIPRLNTRYMPPWSALLRSASVCEHPVLWRLEAPLGFIWNSESASQR